MRSKNLITLNEPRSLSAESYKMFRTNLSYMNIDKTNQVLLFTSSIAEEGKTTSVSNTAITFAMAGMKTLLIECDLRKARVHKMFDLLQEPGLSNLLTDKYYLENVVNKIEEVEGLDVITAGALPPAPVELLASSAMEEVLKEARNRYDKILIDAPPILSVTDAAVLNRLVDGVILVVAANETKKEAIKQAKKSLDRVEAKVLGVLISKMDIKHGGYGYYNYDEESKKERRRKAKEKRKAKKVREI